MAQDQTQQPEGTHHDDYAKTFTAFFELLKERGDGVTKARLANPVEEAGRVGDRSSPT